MPLTWPVAERPVTCVYSETHMESQAVVYDIEFFRRTDGRAEALALEVISLVGERVGLVIEQAHALYRRHETVPRPDGYRIRGADGAVVHEFLEE